MIPAQVRQRARELVDIACALDVDAQRQITLDRQIVDRGEMKDRGRFGTDKCQIVCRKPKILQRNVALNNTEIARGYVC